MYRSIAPFGVNSTTLLPTVCENSWSCVVNKTEPLNDAVFKKYIQIRNNSTSNISTYSNNEINYENDVNKLNVQPNKTSFSSAHYINYLRTKNDELLVFPDHHHFSESDILTLKNKAKDKIIITTEKDFVRLKTEILAEQLYYLPIKSKFVNQQAIFDKTILDYVGTSSRNR